jgi:hypothetical protein
VTGVEIVELTREEGIALFDRAARSMLGISGEEFVRRYAGGEYQRCESEIVDRIIMLLPFARSVVAVCGICGRALDDPDQPMSRDCGGHCFGCVREAERDGGWYEGYGVTWAEWRATVRGDPNPEPGRSRWPA